MNGGDGLQAHREPHAVPKPAETRCAAGHMAPGNTVSKVQPRGHPFEKEETGMDVAFRIETHGGDRQGCEAHDWLRLDQTRAK